MSNDPMTGLRALFAERDDDTDADATKEVARQQGSSGLGLARILEHHTPSAVFSATASESRPEPEPAADFITPRATGRREPLIRSTIAVPNSVRNQIRNAYSRQRWTITDLISETAERLRSGRINDTDITRTYQELRHEPASSIQKIAATRTDLETIDTTAARHRFSRSQLLTITLTRVIDTL